MSNDTIYQIITDRIVPMLEQGVNPWRKTWQSKGGHNMMPKNLATGKEYRGVNVFLLGSMPFASPYWLTFKQAADMGGHVKKGEKGCPVVFWKRTEWNEANTITGEVTKRPGAILRYYTAFNSVQIEGIEIPALPEAPSALPFAHIDRAQAILDNMPNAPRIEHRADFAPAYSPLLDVVKMPEPGQFETPEEYYSTSFHEITHSTGHESRLARTEVTSRNGYGSDPYAREELVAEMGAAFLCGVAGIEQTVLENQAAYLHGWAKRLRANPRWLVTAAAQAQRAADFIRGITYSNTSTTPEAEPTNAQAAA